MVGACGWAHLEFTRINTTPTILPKKIEDRLILGASCGLTARTVFDVDKSSKKRARTEAATTAAATSEEWQLA